MTTVVPCAVIGKTVFVVPIIVLEQLSTVEGAVSVTSHSPFTSSNIGIIGGVLSLMITF
ncbi:hypothetical protein D3C87_985770 [compost metagenome]